MTASTTAESQANAVADRALGALLGVHAGDSLGATLEFTQPNTGEPLADIIGGGPFNWDAGEPTDDTDLTLAAACAYADVAHAGHTPTSTAAVVDAAARRFVAWLDRGPRDIGGTTASALRRIKEGTRPAEAGSADDRSAANGSLMRIIPTAVARRPNSGLLSEESGALSAITHREPRCLDACIVYTTIVSHLIESGDAESAVQNAVATMEWRDDRSRQATLDAVDRAEAGAAMPWQAGGYVLTALGVAVWAVLQRRSAEDVLVEVVNMGGDADTNGAIAGGLLGASDGASALPARWVDRLVAADDLTGCVDALLTLRHS